MTTDDAFVDRLQKLSLINPDHLSENVKLNTLVKFVEIKERNPTWNKKQICQSLGISPSTLTRLSNDLGVPSFYRYRIPLRITTHKKRIEIDHQANKKLPTKKKLIKAGGQDRLESNLNGMVNKQTD